MMNSVAVDENYLFFRLFFFGIGAKKRPASVASTETQPFRDNDLEQFGRFRQGCLR